MKGFGRFGGPGSYGWETRLPEQPVLVGEIIDRPKLPAAFWDSKHMVGHSDPQRFERNVLDQKPDPGLWDQGGLSHLGISLGMCRVCVWEALIVVSQQWSFPTPTRSEGIEPDRLFWGGRLGCRSNSQVPSSGLILVATSYSSYYQLRWQLASGEIGRDYQVLGAADA